MAASPNYAANPRLPDIAQLSAANTNRDGTGTVVEIARGGTAGSVIEAIVIQATAATTGGMIRFFISRDAGATKVLVDEVVVYVITPTAAVTAFRSLVADLVGVVLSGAAARLYASTHNGEAFNIIAQASDL